MLAFAEVSETVSNGTISNERRPPDLNDSPWGWLVSVARAFAWKTANPAAANAVTINAQYGRLLFMWPAGKLPIILLHRETKSLTEIIGLWIVRFSFLGGHADLPCGG